MVRQNLEPSPRTIEPWVEPWAEPWGGEYLLDPQRLKVEGIHIATKNARAHLLTQRSNNLRRA